MYKLKKAVIILLVFAVLMQMFGSVAIIANYVINKELITKAFCVNRKKPKMRCNGKCHLMKELQKENKKEQSPLTELKIQPSAQYFEDIIIFSFTFPSSEKTIFPEFVPGKTVSATIPVFHPPSLS